MPVSASRRASRCLLVGVCLLAGVTVLARPVVAHAGSFSGTLRTVPVPFWLVVTTGGGVVGVSFLATSLLTDHETIRGVNGRAVRLPTVPNAEAVGRRTLRVVGVAGLVAVVVVGFLGPPTALTNLAILLVWVGWWAGYTITTYLVADTWDALDPWRTVASALPSLGRPYPERLGAWPSVVGLLGVVWLEVVSPLAQRPRLLATVVVGYSVVTVAGQVVYGAAWRAHVDPVTRVFRLYGRLAPVRRVDGRLTLSAPGTALARDPDPASADDVAFVVALLWVTTFDGLVSTAAWNGMVRALDALGVPRRLGYLVAVAVGFAVFFGAYRGAARLARRTAATYVTGEYVARWFAPALLPIAAGYHLAHYLGYVLGLSPALLAVAVDPLSPPTAVPTLPVPEWFGAVQLSLVVLGHLLAVWVAHARSFALFPGRLQPIRSQYPFVGVMIIYTTVSLWVVAQPLVEPLI